MGLRNELKKKIWQSKFEWSALHRACYFFSSVPGGERVSFAPLLMFGSSPHIYLFVLWNVQDVQIFVTVNIYSLNAQHICIHLTNFWFIKNCLVKTIMVAMSEFRKNEKIWWSDYNLALSFVAYLMAMYEVSRDCEK